MADDSDGTHRVVGKYHRRSNGAQLPTRFEVGDRITPSEDELRSFPDRFEKVANDGGGDGSSDPNSGGERAEDGAPEGDDGDEFDDLDIDPSEHTVSELADIIRDSDDPEMLDRLWLAEHGGDDRVTVKRKVDERMSALGYGSMSGSSPATRRWRVGLTSTDGDGEDDEE